MCERLVMQLDELNVMYFTGLLHHLDTTPDVTMETESLEIVLFPAA